MGANFIRRFTFDPGNDVLLEIESVNILDLDPPSSITGIGTGTILHFGEFENGPYKTPTEVSGADDLLSNFGSLGYTYGGVPCNNPCARIRYADNAVTGETWNGNGFVQLSGKKFSRLVIVRVDTSVGAVSFTAVPYLVGANAFRFRLSSGQTVVVTAGSGPTTSTATFSGTAASVTGASGTFPTTFAGGETLTVGYDDASATPDFTTTFLSTDQTALQVAARINTYAGFTLVDVVGGQIRFTGRKVGTAAQIRITSGSSGVLTKLGLTAATTAGTGNVGDINSVTPSEVNTVIHAAATNVVVEQQSDGSLRMSTTDGTALAIGNATTALALGFLPGATGVAVPNGGILPAGTLLQQVGGAAQFLVTTQDVTVTAGSVGPYVARVRHAQDDGTGTSIGAGAVSKIVTPPDIGEFTVVNPQIITAALTESQIDAAYVDAITSSEDLNTVAKIVNGVWSARQSNVVRAALRTDVVTTSSQGFYGRSAAVRPPLNTPEAVAESSTNPMGVGATRDERIDYCWPQVNTFVPLIAKRGTAGGIGFTSDGNVDVGADGFLMSILSQLPPEENPGQETSFTTSINSVETGKNAQNLKMPNYTRMKAAGITGIRIDDGTAIFQSGVTSVDPIQLPNRTTIARRRMADYIEDSLAAFVTSYGKKTNSVTRRKHIAMEIRSWLKSLGDRIDSYDVDEKSGNKDPNILGRGLYRIIISVRTLSSLDSIVLACTIGNTVTIERVAA